MPNLASLLKSEIARICRRELRKEMLSVRKSVAAHRREIAALKRAALLLERRIKAIARTGTGGSRIGSADESKQVRFVAKGLVSLRKRLGLSAMEMARLVGVSTQSIYNWEHKKAIPRRGQIEAIVGLRSISRKEARSRLEALQASSQPRASKRTTQAHNSPARSRKSQSRKA